jgi:hypothetical protein
MSRLRVTVISSFLSMSVWLHCQQASTAVQQPRTPAAREQDVNTVDSVIQALYQVISGPAGQKRDWDRFRSLFAPGARLIPAISRPGEKPVIRVLDVEEYIRRTDAIFEKEDFWESEKERRTDTSGNLVHAFSMYESRHAQSGQPFQTGVNSIQLYGDGTRWWIVTVMWNSTR